MPVFLSGSLIITGSITTSGTITAQTLVVQTITSSIVNMTGSNIFGSRLTDRQTFTGSVFITGSISQTGSNTTSSFTGNVGIGTTTPTSLLEAQANQNAQTGIRVRNSTAGTSAGVEFGAYTNSGNGGFGKYSTGNTPYKNISAASTYVYNGASGDIALLNDVSAGNISFAAGSASTAQMFLSASGNVGIGTTSPSTVFHVNGSSSRVAVITTSGALSSGFYDAFQILAANQTGGGLSLNVGKAESNNNLAKMVYFHSSDGSTSNRLGFGFYGADGLVNILANGNVGFNTTSPTGSRTTNLVQVAGSNAVLRVGPWFSTDDRDFVEIQADGANTRLYSPNEDFSFHNPVGNANITGSTVNICSTASTLFFNASSERMRINSNGEFLVGTTVATSTDPVHRFGTNGGTTYARIMIQERVGVWLSLNTGAANIGTVYQNGSVVVYGGTSDYRLKENVKPMTGGLERVMKLNPVEYTWKRDGSYGEGFIAHELQEVVPIAVTGTKDGLNEVGDPDWQNVDKSHIVPILVKAIQELEARVKELENK